MRIKYFKYHPPTRNYCETCSSLNGHLQPIINAEKGKASAAANFPFHNWYNFVLGYTPAFPDYILNREKVSKNQFVVDPFMGSGTTLVSCKNHGISSGGIDANDFFKFAAETKLTWDIDVKKASIITKELINKIAEKYENFAWLTSSDVEFTIPFFGQGKQDYREYTEKYRPSSLPTKYISDAPFAKLNIIKDILCEYSWPNDKIKHLFWLAFATSILSASNIGYGPGFGIKKPKIDVDVLSTFKKIIERMIFDLKSLNTEKIKTYSSTYLGDSRKLSHYFKENSVDLMITSPPYPGDHEYTKHSKLELIFLDFASSIEEFRLIKQRMLRGSTTNIYKNDNEGNNIKDIKSIAIVVDEIDKRLQEDCATSGFEKLYTRLIWEYFGGMYNVFREALKVLKPGGKFILLASDSHAFKMVHIETAKLLQEVGEKAGFCNGHIELWQLKTSTSHKYKLLENILTLEKPA